MYTSFLQAPIVTNECPEWKQLGSAIDATHVYFTMASDHLVVAVQQEQYVVVFSFDDNSMSWSIHENKIDPGF